ncbi:MAG: hypothetical protein KDD44_06405 [Bdellovibrionales bacterium]|nr:hypothetical protein [Bdellovibrionales bacterium]
MQNKLVYAFSLVLALALGIFGTVAYQSHSDHEARLARLEQSSFLYVPDGKLAVVGSAEHWGSVTNAVYGPGIQRIPREYADFLSTWFIDQQPQYVGDWFEMNVNGVPCLVMVSGTYQPSPEACLHYRRIQEQTFGGMNTGIFEPLVRQTLYQRQIGPTGPEGGEWFQIASDVQAIYNHDVTDPRLRLGKLTIKVERRS